MKLVKGIILTAAALTLALALGTAFAGHVEGSVLPAAMINPGEGKITITLTNNNDADSDVVISDIFIASPSYPEICFDTNGVSISPGDSGKFSDSVFFSEEMLDSPIPFQVQWLEGGEAKSKNVSVKVQRSQSSDISVTRVTDAKQASPGEEITLTYTVANNGDTPVEVLSLVDREINGKNSLCGKFELAPLDHAQIPFTYKMGRSTVASEPVVTYSRGGEKSTASAPPITLGMINPRLSVEVIPGEPSATGVLFTINITNNGNQKISHITINDDLGNKVTPDAFALAVGESRQLTYNVLPEAERYVLFNITGTYASGDKYEYKTKSSVVRRYIDPSLLGIEFSAQVTGSLNSAGSIDVKFDVNNTGTMPMHNLIISERTAETAPDGSEQPTLSEIFRTDTLPMGLFTTTCSVYAGGPRDITFVVQMTDPAGNPYSYTAYVSAEYLELGDVKSTEEAKENAIHTLGASAGSFINRALDTAFRTLAALTAVSAAAMAVLYILEIRQRRAARRRAARRRAAEKKRERQGF